MPAINNTVIPDQKIMDEDSYYKENNLSLTHAEYVYASVREWYKTKGLDVPKEDVSACKLYIKEEMEEKARFEESLKNSTPLCEATATSPSSYWKDYWDKKKAAGYVTKKDAAKNKKE
jgi:hypothetical protein